MEWDDVSELRSPTGLLFIPQVIYEHGEAWCNGTVRENRRTQRKLVPVTLSPPQIPHGLIRARNRSSKVRFRWPCCRHHHRDEWRSLSMYETTRCNMTEDSHLQNRRRENLRSQSELILFQLQMLRCLKLAGNVSWKTTRQRRAGDVTAYLTITDIRLQSEGNCSNP
jgi:hypothetical protein